jgi:hypothetical protein
VSVETSQFFKHYFVSGRVSKADAAGLVEFTVNRDLAEFHDVMGALAVPAPPEEDMRKELDRMRRRAELAERRLEEAQDALTRLWYPDTTGQ